MAMIRFTLKFKHSVIPLLIKRDYVKHLVPPCVKTKYLPPKAGKDFAIKRLCIIVIQLSFT